MPESETFCISSSSDETIRLWHLKDSSKDRIIGYHNYIRRLVKIS